MGPEEADLLGDAVAVHLVDRRRVAGGGHEQADERLPLGAAHGVADEHHPLAAQALERRPGIEAGQVAAARAPPPGLVGAVPPAVGLAIEAPLGEGAGGAVVERVGEVPHPLAAEDVASSGGGVGGEVEGGECGGGGGAEGWEEEEGGEGEGEEPDEDGGGEGPVEVELGGGVVGGLHGDAGDHIFRGGRRGSGGGGEERHRRGDAEMGAVGR